MTGDTSAPARNGTDTDGADEATVASYDDLLATLDVLEQEALRKVESGRVYSNSNERTRIKWIRIAKDVVAEKRKVRAERDLEELSKRVEELEDDHDRELGDLY
jgi:hypothetical protein